MTVIADLKTKQNVHPKKQKIDYRNIKTIDTDQFKSDIKDSDLIRNPKSTASELYNQFRETLSALLNRHALLKSKTVSQKPPNPWMTPEIESAKCKRRNLEHVWRKTCLPLDRSRYTNQSHLCNRMMANARRQYISAHIKENEENPRKLWNAVKQNPSQNFNSIIARYEGHSFSVF